MVSWAGPSIIAHAYSTLHAGPLYVKILDKISFSIYGTCSLWCQIKIGTNHRYPKKSRLLKFDMCRLRVLPFPKAFLQWPLTELTIETRQVVRAISQSIYF